MKRISKLFLSLFLISLVAIACGRKENPVDQYVSVLEEAITMARNADNEVELNRLDSLTKVQDNLLKTNADYKLTDSDKEKIKKVTADYINVLMEKTMDLTNIPDSLRPVYQSQIPVLIQASDQFIDGATELGQLSH